jgi:hypothetical protein
MRIALTDIALKFPLTFAIILCCWVAGVSRRAGLFFDTWNWEHGLPILILIACTMSALYRLYGLNRVGVIVGSIISIVIITVIDYGLRNSDLYKIATFYLWHIAVVATIISLLVLLFRRKREDGGLILAIAWLLFIVLVLGTGAAHMNHRSNAMIGVDYLVLVAVSLVAAEVSRQYCQWRSRTRS